MSSLPWTARPARSLPLLVVIVTTIVALGVSILSLLSGWLTVFQNLFYIPIILACLYYTYRGFVFSVILSCTYFALMSSVSSDPVVLEGALIRVVIFIFVAGVIAYISSGRMKAEDALQESEKRYHDFFRTSRDAVFMVSPEGAWIDFNSAALELFGYHIREEFLAVPVNGMFDRPEDWDDLVRVVESDGYAREYPARLVRRDGSTIDALITSVPLRKDDGSVAAFIGSIRDITELKRVQTQLRTEKDLWQATFDSIPEGIAILDEHHRVVQANRAMAGILGTTPEKTRGMACYESVHGTDRPPLFCPHTRLLEDGRTHSEETHLPLLGGYYMITVSPLFRANGSISGSVHVIRDITARKEAEKALRESEARYRELFESMSSGVAVCKIIGDGEKFIVREFNRAAERIEGISREDIVGKNIADVLPSVRDSGIIDVFRRVWSTSSHEFLPEFMVRRAPGLEIWWEAWVYRLPDRDVVIVYNDITARKQSERELSFKTTLLETEQETSIDGILAVDRAGKILSFNRPFAELWGIPDEIIESQSDEMALSHVHDLLVDPEDFIARVRFLYDHPEEKSREEVKLKDGRVFDRYSAPMISPEGVNYGRVWYFRDITLRKRTEEALEMANKKLNLLGSTTRHDITNQLTLVTGYLSLLEKGCPDPAFTDFFTRISRATDRITAIIQFSRTYEQLGIRAPAWQEVSGLVDHAARAMPWDRVVLGNELPKGLVIFADPMVLTVFSNLMDNAIRHGETITKVTFSAQTRDGDLVIVCQDDGIGIPDAEKEMIFSRGYGKNTGLGLFLAREILAITGIAITENGVASEGARFEMVVPKGAYRFGT